MTNEPLYIQSTDGQRQYRVEYSEDAATATIYGMALGENATFKDTGVERTVPDLLSGSYFSLNYEVISAVEALNREEAQSFTEKCRTFEISNTDANGDVHKFVYDDGTKEMNEYLNGEPVNRTLESTFVYAAYRYAKQMLQIYCDECAFEIKDEAHDISFAVYASPDNTDYRVFAYQKDDYGITLVDGNTDYEKYSNIDSAIEDAKRYADPNAQFDKLLEISLTPNHEKAEFTLSVTTESTTGKTTLTSTYSFDTYCSDEGIKTEINEDKFYADYCESHRENLRYDKSCNSEYFEGCNYERDLEEAQDEFYEELYNDEYDNFKASAAAVLFEELEIPAELHPADLARLNSEYADTKLKLNPAVEKTNAKEEITRD